MFATWSSPFKDLHSEEGTQEYQTIEAYLNPIQFHLAQTPNFLTTWPLGHLAISIYQLTYRLAGKQILKNGLLCMFYMVFVNTQLIHFGRLSLHGYHGCSPVNAIEKKNETSSYPQDI